MRRRHSRIRDMTLSSERVFMSSTCSKIPFTSVVLSREYYKTIPKLQAQVAVPLYKSNTLTALLFFSPHTTDDPLPLPRVRICYTTTRLPPGGIF